ncbi:hypothetical protein [Lacinutrix mariniflava]|uniref:hypothetical protein n=1 Tax=Lacinutrix mariniflava TaxID=342955 RepID=UPI0006E27C41|nr:hypothetical protein [Lacinutrix mariniflava]
MKIIFLLISSLFIFTINAQNKIGSFTTDKGETIDVYENKDNIVDLDLASRMIIKGNVILTSEKLIYFDASNKVKKIKQHKVELLNFDGRTFKNLPITKIGQKRLHEIFIENDKYILTNYSSTLGNYFYIFNKNDMKIVKKKTHHSLKKKDDYKSLDKIIKKYFSNCPEIFDQIKQNIRNLDYAWKDANGNWLIKNNMFNGFVNYKCN